MKTGNNAPRKVSASDDVRQKIVVGVAGGSAAGKTTLCQNINRQMAFDRNFKVEIISLDSFYKNVDKTEVDITEYNFDHPNALDFDLAYKTLVSLIESNEPVPVPQYSFIEHARMKEPTYVGPANIIFFEGLMAFYDKRIRDLLTYKIFINCDDDIRLCRRLKRDTTERGRSVISVLEQYNKFVKNAFRDFIHPSIVYADIIIPGFRNNRVSVDFIVQHIKNMARRITFKEKAVKTKTFIFGQSEIYDLEAANSYDVKVAMQQESFLVFPTSSEHKKELEFFLTCLLSQIFSVEYFNEIYIFQFLKVLKVLLRQLIDLKKFKESQMQIFSIYNIKEILSVPCNNKHPIKVIFFPVALKDYSKDILTQIKAYIQNNPKTTFIIINTFCDMTFPQMIYRLKMSNVIMINLFVIANDKRFKQIMANNIEVVTENFDWFLHNQYIANQGVKTFAKEFHFYHRPTEEFSLLSYDLELKKCEGEDRPRVKSIREEHEQVGLIKQFQVYPQEHPNLCGYHALSTIICLEHGRDIKSKYAFVDNYMLLSGSIGKVDFQLLERHNLPVALHTKPFELIKCIGVLFYSFKYIQNTEDQNQQLQRLFDELISGKKAHIYVVLGVHVHYVLVKITKTAISFYDSLHNTIRDIWNGTEQNFTQEEKTHKDFKDRKIHLRDLKESLQILLDLLNQKTTIHAIALEKILEDITDSFNPIKDNPAEIDHWIANEYPKGVLVSQLLTPLEEKKVELSQQHQKKLKQWLSHPKIAQLLKDHKDLIKI